MTTTIPFHGIIIESPTFNPRHVHIIDGKKLKLQFGSNTYKFDEESAIVFAEFLQQLVPKQEKEPEEATPNTTTVTPDDVLHFVPCGPPRWVIGTNNGEDSSNRQDEIEDLKEQVEELTIRNKALVEKLNTAEYMKECYRKDAIVFEARLMAQK